MAQLAAKRLAEHRTWKQLSLAQKLSQRLKTLSATEETGPDG
jgi:hypothetical protein